MKCYTRNLEVEAEQYIGDVKAFALTELTPSTFPRHSASFQCPESEETLTVLRYDWVVKYPDGSFEVHSAIDFESRFAGYSETKSLKESHERLSWVLGGVSTIALGHLPDGQYVGKPIAALEEVLRLRQFVDAVLQVEEKLASPVAQMEAIEKIIKRFKEC